MGRIRVGAAAAVGLVLAGAMIPLTGGTAGAVANPVIVVTTTADVTNASDGVLSLREAMSLANATPGPDTIQLADGAVYLLTICTPGSLEEDLNGSGDLDATDVAGLTIDGGAQVVGTTTVTQTCRATTGVNAHADERVIESTTGALSLTHLALTGGRGSPGIAVEAVGDLSLTSVLVAGSATSSGGSSPGAVQVERGSLALVNSTITGTVNGFGVSLNDFTSPTTATIQGSTISNNGLGGVVDDRSYAPAPMLVTGTTVSGNAHGIFTGVGGASILTSTIANNGTPSTGGGLIVGGPTTLTQSTITGNRAFFGGGVLNLGSTLTVDQSTIADNVASSVGGGLMGGATITRSSVVGNTAVIGGGIGIDHSESPSATLTISDSTIAANVASQGGGIGLVAQDGSATNALTLVHASVLNNAATTTGGGNDLTLGVAGVRGAITLRGTAIGSSRSDGVDCVLRGQSIQSGGFNFSVDGSCGLGSSASDVSGGGDPVTKPVYAGGGSQPSWISHEVLAFGSPLLGAIPSGSPLCAGTDQLGNPRPPTPGSSCDIGSIQSQTPAYTNDGSFVALSPTRVLDTRVGLGNVPMLRGGQPQQMTVGGHGGVPAGATAVVLNLTATNVSSPTFVTAFPGGVLTPPVASNLNVVPGQTVPNLVTVKLGKGGTVGFVNGTGTVDLVADVIGYYEQSYPVMSNLSTVSPTRVIDTRPGPLHLGFSTLGSGQTGSLVIPGAPAGATAAILNVTVTNPTASGFATVLPLADPILSPPSSSNLNFVPGLTVANLVIAKLGIGGGVSFYNSLGSTDFVVDVVGWYTTTSTLAFTSVNPVRLLDTRNPGGPLARFDGGTHHDLLVADGITVPAGAKAVLVNVTAVDPAAPGFLTVYPTAAPPNPPPLASNLNFTAGGIVPNLVVATLSADGKLSIYNGSTGSADVLVDLVGWYR